MFDCCAKLQVLYITPDGLHGELNVAQIEGRRRGRRCFFESKSGLIIALTPTSTRKSRARAAAVRADTSFTFALLDKSDFQDTAHIPTPNSWDLSHSTGARPPRHSSGLVSGPTCPHSVPNETGECARYLLSCMGWWHAIVDTVSCVAWVGYVWRSSAL